jgi:hypothetical protein
VFPVSEMHFVQHRKAGFFLPLESRRDWRLEIASVC